MRRGVVLGAFGIVGVFIACSAGEGASTFPSGVGQNDAGSDGNARDPRYSFSTLSAERSCVQDEDCVLSESIEQCFTCCGAGAIARGDAERAHDAVIAACAEPMSPGRRSCLVNCGQFHSSCFEGLCVAVREKNQPWINFCGAPIPKPTGETTLGPGPACGASAVTSGFESPFDPSWVVSDPDAIRIDHDNPIAGGASLRLSYRQKDATLTLPQPNACALRIAFTMRTHLLSSGITLARIVVGDGSWFYIRLNECGFSVAEELHTTESASLAPGGPVWTVADDTPTRVVVTLDLGAKTISTTLAKVGDPLPTVKTGAVLTNLPDTHAIRAVELGPAPGFESSGVGTVWIDDLSID